MKMRGAEGIQIIPHYTFWITLPFKLKVKTFIKYHKNLFLMFCSLQSHFASMDVDLKVMGMTRFDQQSVKWKQYKE